MLQRLLRAAFLLVAISIPSHLMAQMTIEESAPEKDTKVDLRSELKQTQIDAEYFSAAREEARKAAIRKERNYLEIISSLQGSLTSLNDTWIETSGGDNTIALLGNFSLRHTYTLEKFFVDTRFNARFGYNRVKIDVPTDDPENPTSNEGVWFKNQDELNLSIAPSMTISDLWSYGMTFSFRTQLASGYTSRSQQEQIHLKSSFMAPGYLNISGGVTYKSPNAKLPFTVNVAPLALSAVFVNNAVVRENFTYQFKDHDEANFKYTDPYGVSPYTNSKYEGGSSIQIYFDRTFKELSNIRYSTSLFSFYGWMTKSTYDNIIDDYDEYKVALKDWEASKKGIRPMLGIQPTVRWENTIQIPATKMLTTMINFQLYYNRAQSVDIQTQTMISVGLSYTFKNK